MDSPQIRLFPRSLLALGRGDGLGEGLDGRFPRLLLAEWLSRLSHPVFTLGFSNGFSCDVFVCHDALTSICDFVH
jgi:hypothetical protein